MYVNVLNSAEAAAGLSAACSVQLTMAQYAYKTLYKSLKHNATR
jgi:hypothetical protein